MVRHSTNASELWKSFPWKKFRRNLFRLQCRVFKAVSVGELRKARSLQKLILKSQAAQILKRIEEFLRARGLNISPSKTQITAATDGFDFLGWHFQVQNNGKLRCTPSVENFKAFRRKIKAIINNSNYGATVKAEKLAPVVRGWRNYHRYCQMEGSRFKLWHTSHRAYRVFNRETHQDKHTCEKLINQAFPAVSYSQFKHVMVAGAKSPYDGDLAYWSQRQSQLYDGHTSAALKRQNHTCGSCALNFMPGEKIHLHHVDGNHHNWKKPNLLAVHESCHDSIHMSLSSD